jgi:hypothetical protein
MVAGFNNRYLDGVVSPGGNGVPSQAHPADSELKQSKTLIIIPTHLQYEISKAQALLMRNNI